MDFDKWTPDKPPGKPKVKRTHDQHSPAQPNSPTAIEDGLGAQKDKQQPLQEE